jgi:imidazolonepropionase-like amidohydrolase
LIWSTRARAAALGIALTAAVVSLSALQARPSVPLDVVIRHVNIPDLTGGPTLRDHRIGIAGDRIVSIAPDDGNDETDPAAAVVVDGGGAFVTPGLWDMHAHILEYPGLPAAAVAGATFPLYVANGVLGVRDMGTHDFDTLKRLREEVNSGKLLGPRLVISGRPLDGKPPTDWIKRPIATAAEAREAVRDLRASGADFVKVYERLSRAAYLAVADECRKQHLMFVGHLPLAVTPREAILAGQRGIEHMGQGRLRDRCYGYLPEGEKPAPDADPIATSRLMRAMNNAFAGRVDPVWAPDTTAWIASTTGQGILAALDRDLGPVQSLVVLRRSPRAGGMDVAVLARQARGERMYKFHVEAIRRIEWLPNEPDVELPGEVEALAAELRGRGVWVTPTLTPLRAIAHRLALMVKPDPRLVYVTSEVRDALQPSADPRYKTWTAVEWDFIQRAYDRDARLAASLRRLGVRMLAGTDGVTDYCLPGFGLHDELALLVAAGFTPLEALQAATTEPAAFMNRSRDMGSVAVGKLADLVLLGGDPTANIRHAASIRAVVRGGRYLDRAELDGMLERVRLLVQGGRQ